MTGVLFSAISPADLRKFAKLLSFSDVIVKKISQLLERDPSNFATNYSKWSMLFITLKDCGGSKALFSSKISIRG